MNIKALITTLVLGSSSVAMARPVAPIHDRPIPVEPDGGPGYMPAPRPIYQPAPRPYYPGAYHRASWTTLGGVSHIVDGEMSFRPARFRGEQQFSTLKLQSDAGKSLIYRVLIQFQNGRTQVVELNQYLNASNPSIQIDLNGRARSIAKVTVVGRNARQSAYRVLAI
jgi:hypothetical protein